MTTTATADSSALFSVRRLNRLAEALSCRTYLEIGVNKGETLLAVHTLHALRHSHPGTVIAIDDTIPCNDLLLITLIDGGNPWTLIWRPPIISGSAAIFRSMHPFPKRMAFAR